MEGLQADFRLNQLLDIVAEHKKVKVAITPQKEVTSSAPCGDVTICCPKHGGREMELYCNTCEETICFKCIMNGEKHHSHDYEDLNKAITSSLEPMEKQLRTIKKALVKLDARCDQISDQQAAIETNIQNTITRLHSRLEVRKSELINQVHQLTQAKLKSLVAQRERIKITQAQLSSALLLMRENLKAGNQGEVLQMKNITEKQVKELTTTLQPSTLEPSTEADMVLSELVDLSTQCQNYGKVYATGSPDPSKCCAIGKDTATVGEKSTAVLKSLNFYSQPCKILQGITCEFVSEIAGTRKCSLERRGQSQYEISYKPIVKGRHQLHIKVEGQHIRGSPFPVTAKSPVEKLGTPILTIGRAWGPDGVAVNQRGEVVVTELGGHCVSVFSPGGERLRSFGTRGFGQGQFQHPCGVAVDGEENVLVADSDNHRIQKFTAQGEFLTAVGTEGTGPLQFDSPNGIVFNASNGRVYVVDSENNRIQILNSDLSYFDTFGKRGSGKGQFYDPQYIACDSTGNVYVADYDNDRIQVFTAEGKFLKMFGTHGEGRGELNCPQGLAIDSSDRVYVSESGNHRVSVFTSEGQFVTSFGSEGEGPGQFKFPAGLAVDSSGVVYVCDYRNRVQLF